MKRLLLSSLLLAPILSWATMADDVTIEDPYVRETLTNVHTTAGYAKLKNNSNTEIDLVGVSSPKAKKIELHTIKIEKDVAKMKTIKKIVIPPNNTTNLEPGSYHLMLFTVDVPLQGNNEVPVTFKFSDGSTKDVKMKVRDVRAPWLDKPTPIPPKTSGTKSNTAPQ